MRLATSSSIPQGTIGALYYDMVKHFTYLYLSFLQLLQSAHCFPARSRANTFRHNCLQTRMAGALRHIAQQLGSVATWNESALL